MEKFAQDRLCTWEPEKVGVLFLSRRNLADNAYVYASKAYSPFWKLEVQGPACWTPSVILDEGST